MASNTVAPSLVVPFASLISTRKTISDEGLKAIFQDFVKQFLSWIRNRLLREISLEEEQGQGRGFKTIAENSRRSRIVLWKRLSDGIERKSHATQPEFDSVLGFANEAFLSVAGVEELLRHWSVYPPRDKSAKQELEEKLEAYLREFSAWVSDARNSEEYVRLLEEKAQEFDDALPSGKQATGDADRCCELSREILDVLFWIDLLGETKLTKVRETRELLEKGANLLERCGAKQLYVDNIRRRATDATEYERKTMHVLEELHSALQDEWDFWKENEYDYEEKYKGKLVAIRERRIVAADNEEELSAKLKAKGWWGRQYLELSVGRSDEAFEDDSFGNADGNK